MSLEEEQSRPGRAMMQFSDYYAWMEGNQVTLLSPDQIARHGHYDSHTRQLILEGEADAASRRRALAFSSLPSWLYREQRYH